MTQTGLRDFYLKMWYKRKRDFDGMTLRLPYPDDFKIVENLASGAEIFIGIYVHPIFRIATTLAIIVIERIIATAI